MREQTFDLSSDPIPVFSTVTIGSEPSSPRLCPQATVSAGEGRWGHVPPCQERDSVTYLGTIGARYAGSGYWALSSRESA